MSAALIVYLIGFLVSLTTVLMAWVITIVSIAVMVLLVSFIEADKRFITYLLKYGKLVKLVIVSLIVSMLLLVAIPSKNDMYIIVGLYIGEQVITSEKGSAILDKSYEAIMTKLDDVITENTKEQEPETEK